VSAIQILYLFSVIIACSSIWILVIGFKNQATSYHVLLFLSIFITNLSYFFLSISKSADDALLASKFTCIDGTFITLFLMMVMCHISNIKVSNKFIIPAVLLNSFLFAMICTSGYFPYHYKSVVFHNETGYSYLVKDYGWHHTFYLCIVVLYMLAPIAICIYAFIHRNKASYIHTILLASCQVIAILLYFIEGFLGLKFDILPFSYNISEIIILFIINRTSLYDVNKNIQLKLSQTQGYGYVVLDSSMKYIGCDENAHIFFPELKELIIDKEIHQPYLREEFAEWINTSKGKTVDPKYIKRDDKDLKVTIEPFYNSNKTKLVGYLLEVYDDTKNQHYIRNLTSMNEELKVVNAELDEMAKKAYEASQAKSQFLSLMSHEIRTPINAILGMNEMISKEAQNPAIIEYASDIQSSGQWLLALINDILDFSKIEAGKMEIINNDYKLTDLLHEIRIMSETRAKDKNLDLIFELDPNSPSILNGDEVKIRQIIINLLTNAIKYTDKGSVNLTISSNNISDSVSMIKITVKDSGRGITEKGLKNLFTVFSRADEAQNAGIEGTGLGLSITKSYTELMGGQISVNSEYQKGSTFTVEIPQKIVDISPVGQMTADNTSKSTEHAENVQKIKQGIRIMAVDDVAVNLKLFTLFLKNEDITIDMAKSGQQSVDLAKQNLYDIIFMDHMMPGMNGSQALKLIHNDEDSLNKNTPIVVLTANAINGARDEYLNEGFSDYMSKPFKSDQLFEMINKYVS